MSDWKLPDDQIEGFFEHAPKIWTWHNHELRELLRAQARKLVEYIDKPCNVIGHSMYGFPRHRCIFCMEQVRQEIDDTS